MKWSHIFLSLLCVGFVSIKADENKTLILGTLQFPKTIKTAPEQFQVLYQGDEYPVQTDKSERAYSDKGYFEIYEQNNIDELYILITEYLKLPDQNNFTHFQTSPDHAYKLFKLTKNTQYNDDGQPVFSWDVQSMKNKEKMRQVPDKTVILFMPPSYIKDLGQEVSQQDEHVVRLPKIVFSDTISETEFQETCAKMILALVDFKMFHTKEAKQSMLVAGNRLVTMPFCKI